MEANQTFSPKLPVFSRAVNGSAIGKPSYSLEVKGITVDYTLKSQIRRRLQDLKKQNEGLVDNIGQRDNEIDKIIASNKKYISVLAHDLKSPFSTIYGVLEIIRECVHEKRYDEMEEYIDIASSSSLNTTNLIDNILAWSQSQTNGNRYMPIMFNLASLVNQEISNSYLAIKLKKLTLSHSVPSTYYVRADIQMTRSILRNLITNAIKFTNTGGSIFISAMLNKSFIDIMVKDDGIGISREDQLVLFQKDPRDLITYNGNVKSKGLGLALCKEFVEIHGGSLRVESQPGKGSSFIFSLPDFK